ncbi:MAG TPA: DUF885 family protein [Longimicrobiales bacterium]|nr:DUF885 family protein [Longimicrobiales bacterium]
MKGITRATLLGTVLLAIPASGGAQAPGDSVIPPPARALAATTSEVWQLVDRYAQDRSALFRRYPLGYAPERAERLRPFYAGWRTNLRRLDYQALGVEERIDWQLLDNQLRYQLELLERERRLMAEMQGFLPFAADLMALETARIAMAPVDARGAAALLAALPARVTETRKALEARQEADSAGVSRIVALRAASALEDLRRALSRWYGHYTGYDPLFTWWVQEPYGGAEKALTAYEKFLREKVVGYEEGEDEPIVGDPIGAEGMRADLLYEMMPYTPEELIAIARRELAWGEEQMRQAARDLGYGDDWKAALEHVKTLHVEPGAQPALVVELAEEAERFLEERDLVTIPPLAKEIWRMEMMSPEMQKVAPFFLGGEIVRVAFPTAEMSHEEKLMSLRGNNVHFSRAVVHHELIPGHHLQGFMAARHNPHRRVFSTPFWNEGGALYWEMLLWDLDFPQSPEDRIGMLFWRMHRAARIIFSLSFHLERMTPEEAIDFLVERVGHERENAEAEVRRSFNGSYSPLYQAAYMLGGLQLRALHEELVGGGRMSNREFHDAILEGGPMPIEMVRARLLGIALPQDFTPSWRFAGDPR